MSDDQTITKALEKIAAAEAEVFYWKDFVNKADKLNDRDPRFADLGTGGGASAASPAAGSKRWQPGSFLGKPFAAAVRLVLERREETAGGEPAPASVDEIHAALAEGSYDFGSSNAESQKQSIRISLGKNSVTFVRLPNTDLFGLLEWYPGLKKTSRRRSGDDNVTSTDAESGGSEEVPESPGTLNDVLS
jgi:hypothetical protein